MTVQERSVSCSKIREALWLSACTFIALLLIVLCFDCGMAYGYTGKALREDARGKHEAFQGKIQEELGAIKPPSEVTEDALRNGTSSPEQSQPEVQNNGAPEETGQRPNVYVPDEDEEPDEDEGKNKWICNLAAVAFLVLFVFFIIKYRKAIADFASRRE